MNTQSIFQVGNSNAVTIPIPLMKKIGLKRGHRVLVERLGNTDNLIIITKPEKKVAKNAVSAEFQKWLSTFLEEDKELLDDLARR